MHGMFRHVLEGTVSGRDADGIEVAGMEVTFALPTGGTFSVQLDATAADSFARLFDDTKARVALKEEIDALHREVSKAKEEARAARADAGFPASVTEAITALRAIASVAKPIPQLEPLFTLAQGAVNALIADPETAEMPMRNVEVVTHRAIGEGIERAFEAQYAGALKDMTRQHGNLREQIGELVETVERLGWVTSAQEVGRLQKVVHETSWIGQTDMGQ